MTDPTMIETDGEDEPVLSCAALTHIGLVRKLNEDSHLDRRDLGLWAVADGMGGHHAGDLASGTIVAALDAIQPQETARDLMLAVREALDHANNDLLNHAERYEGRAIIASTVVCLLIFEQYYAGVWAGDSRLYLLRDSRIIQISHDHSVVQELVDAGQIDHEAAKRHPSGNQVTRAIGVTETVDLEVVQDDLHPGDVFLLCSDGITRIIDDAEIAEVLASNEPEAAVRVLIETTLARGAPDNATAVVVRCGQTGADGEFDEPADADTSVSER